MLLAATLSLAIWVYLLLGHGRFWQAGPTLTAASPTAPAPSLAIIVPARDEAASIGRALRSLLAQEYPGPLRIILVDDCSQDGTAEIAAGITDPRLTVLTGAERPVGWSGKLWALQPGDRSAACPSEMLLLTDADIEHRLGTRAATLVAKAQSGGPRYGERNGGAELSRASPERALVPAFVFFFALLYPFALVNDARQPGCGGGGRHGADPGAKRWRRIGGIAAMRGALIDDVTLAGLVKKRGGRIWLGHSAACGEHPPLPDAPARCGA